MIWNFVYEKIFYLAISNHFLVGNFSYKWYRCVYFYENYKKEMKNHLVLQHFHQV